MIDSGILPDNRVLIPRTPARPPPREIPAKSGHTGLAMGEVQGLHLADAGMRPLLVIFLLTALTASPALAEEPWGKLSLGMDISYLRWQRGGQWAFGIEGAFGIRLIDALYLNARLTLPLPTLVIVGNEVSAGGELEYRWVDPPDGWAFSTALGAAWTIHWPEATIVIMADGPGPAPVRTFEYGTGTRYWASARLGHRSSHAGAFVELGLDLRGLLVRPDGHPHDPGKYHYFVGPRFGLALEYSF
jgi:hypothetical protein